MARIKETISLQEFIIRVRMILRRPTWSVSKFVWRSMLFIYSQIDPEDFLWFLEETEKRELPYQLGQKNKSKFWNRNVR